MCPHHSLEEAELFTQQAAETTEMLRGQAGHGARACLSALLTKQPLLQPALQRGLLSEFPVETWDPRQAGALLQSMIRDRTAPAGKAQVLETAPVDSMQSHQRGDPCGLGEAQPHPPATEDLGRQTLPQETLE